MFQVNCKFLQLSYFEKMRGTGGTDGQKDRLGVTPNAVPR